MAEHLRLVPRENGPNVPQCLRDLADAYERGDHDMPYGFAYVSEGYEGLTCGIIGRVDEIRACGLFTVAGQFMGSAATE